MDKTIPQPYAVPTLVGAVTDYSKRVHTMDQSTADATRLQQLATGLRESVKKAVVGGHPGRDAPTQTRARLWGVGVAGMEYRSGEWSEKSFCLTCTFCTFRTFCPALKAEPALRKSVHFLESNLHCFCTFCPVFAPFDRLRTCFGRVLAANGAWHIMIRDNVERAGASDCRACPGNAPGVFICSQE